MAAERVLADLQAQFAILVGRLDTYATANDERFASGEESLTRTLERLDAAATSRDETLADAVNRMETRASERAREVEDRMAMAFASFSDAQERHAASLRHDAAIASTALETGRGGMRSWLD